MAKLIVQHGYRERDEILLTKASTSIGRDASCDISIPDEQVSRNHARIIEVHGDFFVEDLDSINGTFLNQAPVRERQLIKHLDVLQISSNVVFVFNDAPAAVEDRPRDAAHQTQHVYTLEYLRETVHRIEENVCKVFKGNPAVVRNLLLGILADGHVLIEDVPGVGKTVLAKAFAKSIQGTFRRVQFTPDLLPSDITGVSMYDEKKREFTFIPGPIFGNIILADEINRTTPRTQSSLLECMSEAVVTIDGLAHVLPKPFFVIATQNPVEFHGTYPLPEAQLDRFLMRIGVGYPTPAVEKDILISQFKSHPLNVITYVAKTVDMVQCQALVRQIHVAPPVVDYILKISAATRKHPELHMGVSPRASLALMHAAQALAAYNARGFVVPKDIRELAGPVLAHRLVLKVRGRSQQATVEHILEEIIKDIPLDEEQIQSR